MNKKEASKLIVFSVLCFACISAFALFFFVINSKEYNKFKRENQASRQKFAQLVEKVKNGQQQFKTDKWIEYIELEQKATDSQYETIVSLINILRDIGWFSLVMAVLNALAILYVRQQTNQHQSTPS
jgi:hypothetical protein